MKFIFVATLLAMTIPVFSSCSGSCLADLRELRTRSIQRKLSVFLKTSQLESSEDSFDSPQPMLREASMAVNYSSSEERSSSIAWIPGIAVDDDVTAVRFRLNQQQRRQQIIETQLNVKLVLAEPLLDEPTKVIVRIYEKTDNKATEIARETIYLMNEKRIWIPIEDSSFLKKGNALIIEALVDGINIATDMFEANNLQEDLPFLKVTFSERRPRIARSAESLCDDANYKGCCVHRLKVSTSFLNMKVTPMVVDVGICSGDCQINSHHLPRSEYGNLLSEEKIRTNRTIPMCCHPVQYDPLKILVKTNDGQVIEKHIPDIIVKRCGCI